MLARILAIAGRMTALMLLAGVLPLCLSICVTLVWFGEKPIFRQSRVGYLGRPFTILKFRTIPEDGWPAFETRDAGRARVLHRFTSVLRRTGLDEIPQLWNVARGDMRLIGPRPLTPDDYRALPDLRALRGQVRPGMTGLAQVNGGQSLDAENKLLLDIYMIERAGPAMYAEIIARSIARCIGLTRFVLAPDDTLLQRARTHVRTRGAHAGTVGESEETGAPGATPAACGLTA